MKNKKRFSTKDVKLNFSTKAHDAKVEEKVKQFEKEQLSRKQNEALARISDKWKNLKKRITGQKQGATPQQLIEELHKFLGDVYPLLGKCSEAARDQTITMVEDTIAKIVSTDGGKTGSIRQFIPEGRKAQPKVYQFDDQAELESIPFVGEFMKQPNFVGFALDAGRMVAIYSTSEMPVVGSLVLPRGKPFCYPPLKMLADEIQKSIQESN